MKNRDQIYKITPTKMDSERTDIIEGVEKNVRKFSNYYLRRVKRSFHRYDLRRKFSLTGRRKNNNKKELLQIKK